MIIAVTGHRPEGCNADEETVRRRLRAVFIEARPACVIVGMASGVDLWAGDEALGLGIDVWAAKPWAGHKPRQSDAELYAKVIADASRIVNVVEQEGYPGHWVYQVRNEWMVDNSTHVLAYWNGKPKGGTYNCVKYARGKKPIRNVYQ